MASVLLVGGNPFIAEEISRGLSAYGDIDRVTVVKRGHDARALINSDAPDVLVADVDDTVIDAIESLAELWSGKRMRVILVADSLTDEAIRHAVRFGVAYCVLKPVTAAQLHERIIMVKGACARPAETLWPAAGGFTARVNRLLNDFGMLANCLGYQYLRAALMIAVRHEERGKLMLTKEVYPSIASQFNTSQACAETAIRACINSAWEKRAMWRSRMSIFAAKPCNGLFIAVLAQTLINGEDENRA